MEEILLPLKLIIATVIILIINTRLSDEKDIEELFIKNFKLFFSVLSFLDILILSIQSYEDLNPLFKIGGMPLDVAIRETLTSLYSFGSRVIQSIITDGLMTLIFSPLVSVLALLYHRRDLLNIL
jgi:hypothetical protein